MTPHWLRALLLLPFLGLSACGGGGGGGSGPIPSDTPPTANFAFTCTDLVCSFKSTSTDEDVGDSITSYTWNFGDGSGSATSADANHSYAAGNTYDVSLRVTDKLGIPSTVVRKVTVTAAPVPAAPHANFSLSCSSLNCTFTDTSTYDAGSVFQSRIWDFGDSVTLATASPASHSYSATTLTTFTVKLTITDTAGKVSTSTQSIPVAPPATALLTLTQASKVTATLVSTSCSAHGNQVVVAAPITQTILTDGCFAQAQLGTPIALNGGSVFAANTVLQVNVLSGLAGTTALVFQPSIRVSGDFANGWTLTFDDGFGGPGEPDFNDLVILIKATP